MNPCDFVTSTNVVACCIASNKTTDEVALLSSFFLLLGQTLDSWLTYKEVCCSDETTEQSDKTTEQTKEENQPTNQEVMQRLDEIEKLVKKGIIR